MPSAVKNRKSIVFPAAVDLRTSTILNGHRFDSDSHHGVRIRVYQYLGLRYPLGPEWYKFRLDIDLDRYGKTPLQHEWKVYVRPDVWCRACGWFINHTAAALIARGIMTAGAFAEWRLSED